MQQTVRYYKASDLAGNFMCAEFNTFAKKGWFIQSMVNLEGKDMILVVYQKNESIEFFGTLEDIKYEASPATRALVDYLKNEFEGLLKNLFSKDEPSAETKGSKNLGGE